MELVPPTGNHIAAGLLGSHRACLRPLVWSLEGRLRRWPGSGVYRRAAPPHDVTLGSQDTLPLRWLILQTESRCDGARRLRRLGDSTTTTRNEIDTLPPRKRHSVRCRKRRDRSAPFG